MPVSRSLQRLLRIRDLEEEQLRIALESATGELYRLQSAMENAVECERRGKELIESAARTGELMDRQAGLMETYGAQRRATALTPRILAAEEQTSRLREEFLQKRVQRRQAETLIEEAKARDAVEAGRKSQDALDEWFRSRQYRASLDEDEKIPASDDTGDAPVEVAEL